MCWRQVSSWGGYVFLINLIPLHVLVLMLTGRFSHRIYVAYCTVYCLGTVLSMQISFVGFQVRSWTSVTKHEFPNRWIISLFLSVSVARPVLWTHGCIRGVWPVSDSRLCRLPPEQTEHAAVWSVVQECHFTGQYRLALCRHSAHADRWEETLPFKYKKNVKINISFYII